MLSISDPLKAEAEAATEGSADSMLYRAGAGGAVRDSPRPSSGSGPAGSVLGTPIDIDTRERDGESAPLLGGDAADIPALPPKQSSILLPGLMYVATSSSLILLNKHALASFGFGCPNAILLFHCLLAVVLVKASQLMGWIRLEPLKWPLIKVWIPVNLLFVGMIATSYLALQRIGIGMFTVLKNLSNFITIVGDWYFFNRTYNMQVWATLMLMVISAVVGGFTDLQFDLLGYVWQLINCVFTSAYALYLSGTMVRVQQYTSTGERMSEFSMVYYNNLLSVGPVLVLMLLFGELTKLPQELVAQDLEFMMVVLLGGILGFGISFTSLWFVSRSTATIYSLTGSLNKILVAVAGIILFREATSAKNMASIGVGLVAGLVFVLAKQQAVPPVK